MRIKTLHAYSRLRRRARRARAARDAMLRPGQPAREPRLWSLLLPPARNSDLG